MSDARIQTYITEKNQRPLLPKGTRGVTVTTVAISREGRHRAELKNRNLVIKAYEERWGYLDMSWCEITHLHLSIQVVTTLLVYPSL